MHIDPNMTSAWNTSLQGHKLWVMLPGSYPKWIVNGLNSVKDDEQYIQYSAIEYFDQLLDRIKASENIKEFMTCIQKPGETVFVPGGWWHAVLNLDDTMAVTQNFVNNNNLDRVWRSIRKDNGKISRQFLNSMKEKQPSVYKRLLELNQADQFVMLDNRRELPFLLDVTTDSCDTDSSDGSHQADLHSQNSSNSKGSSASSDYEDYVTEKQIAGVNNLLQVNQEESSDGSSDEELESILLLNRQEVEQKKAKQAIRNRKAKVVLVD